MKDIFDVIANGRPEELMDFNAREINQANKKGITPLMVVSQKGKSDKAATLIQGGADIDSMNNHGWTPLQLAAEKGHLQTVQVLAEAGAFIDADFDNGLTALIQASEKGHLRVVEYLLENGAEINAAYIYSGVAETALYRAVKNSRFDVVLLLLERGASPNIGTSILPSQVMTAAAEKGNARIVEALILHNTEITGDELVIASRLGHSEAAAMLLELYKKRRDESDNMYIKGNFENYINEAFIIAGNKETSEIFLQDSSVDIDGTNGKGSYNALSMAVSNNNIEQVELLLKKGAHNDPFYNDERPVNIAAAGGYKEILCLLVDSGASLEPKVTDEGTLYDGPLVYAVCGGKADMVELLVSLGARVDAHHADNYTAHMVAEEKGFSDIVQLLKSLI